MSPGITLEGVDGVEISVPMTQSSDTRPSSPVTTEEHQFTPDMSILNSSTREFDPLGNDNGSPLPSLMDLLDDVSVPARPQTNATTADAPTNRPRTLRIPTDDDDIDEVLFIDDHREVASMRNRISTIQYQVNWKFQRPDGLDKDWFDEKDLSGCQEAVAMYQRWRQAGAHFLTNTGLAPTLAEFRAMDPLWLEIGNNSDKSCLAAAIRIVATNLNVSNFELSEEVISGFKEAHGVPHDAGIPPSKMHDFLKLAYTHGFHYNDAIFSRQLLKQSVGDPIRDICRAILDEPDGEFLVVSVTDSTSHCWVLAKRYKRCIDRSLCMIQDNENLTNTEEIEVPTSKRIKKTKSQIDFQFSLAFTLTTNRLPIDIELYDLPENSVAKWQSMVYKFILTRKRHKEDKHMSLINSGVAYHPSLGLRIPHIASRIRAQRVQRLQFLVQTDNEEPSLWSVLPKQLFRRCMEPFARYSSWDCLMYHPNHNTNHMRLEVLPLLWRKIWANWHRIPLTRKCPETPTQSQLPTMSVWLQIHPLFLVPGSNGPTSLAVALKHHRPFYKFLAQEGLHCLDDFVTTQRVWPSYEEFKLQMEPYVWRFPGDDFPRVFRHLYSLLSLIATTVWQVLGIPLVEAVPPNHEVQIPVGQVWKNVFVPFQQWPRKYIRSICFCAPLLTKQHPLSSDSRNNDLAIKKYMNKTVKPLMRYPTPVQADVWWRILFRMLPVNSRFFFLQDTNPSIIECSFPGCSAVETIQHILFDCKFVKPVWNWHQAAWRPFGIPFTWNTIINLDEFAVSEEWVSHFSVIRRLWVLLVSSLLRDFWIHRNRTKFEGKTVPYIQAVKEVSLVSWTANIRRMLRDPTMDSDEAMQVSEIVEKLKSHTNYTWFWEKNLRATLV
ncbi:hypothetical protein AC1031_017863 [Aphanomyces cochlioides]|nr:hypothetical protein AC1031_017863 [Aphanomyces cochlioides]